VINAAFAIESTKKVVSMTNVVIVARRRIDFILFAANLLKGEYKATVYVLDLSLTSCGQ
jgi:hypothetical protein